MAETPRTAHPSMLQRRPPKTEIEPVTHVSSGRYRTI